MGYQRKTALTQKHIKNSLITLLDIHKFDLITVNQIVEEAEITRSTFYRYYEDKYSLLSEIEEEILNQLHEARQKINQQFTEEDMFTVEVFQQLFESLESYSEAIRVLLGHNGDTSFEMKIKNEIAKRFVNLGELHHVSKVREDLVKEYLYVILIKTFQYWSANKESIDVREVAATIRDIQLKGLRKAIGI
ncbi:TetR/AcrR family transcriptional regulator [Staphylococcus sp. 18_1_E_LY]|uniref:TetR/AcrR family transcriptional regulator n=1 Tax=Staphylococcus lloydii TaxID=2781774 RepID=A0A7T1B039_9STAP|nr:TetR/AcrR family transcriptional regulator [Staphylococcus lloydii]MBF7019922.1 TetR/AcrR family transcriptional regulator [Staphylococcus lloydii]MBF7027605.1 TetR/AcrR family transcriptional regulator [Staphylococcus lloydii]QPM75292.1 TetR/AcrR family transcriptional regulator [Staphylococcus lloydii]